MEIKASCKLDLKSLTALQQINASKLLVKLRPQLQQFIMGLPFAALFLAALLTPAFTGHLTDLKAYSFPLLFFGALGLFMIYYIYHITPGKQYEAMGKEKNTLNHYTFTEDCLKVRTEARDMSGESIIKYIFFLKVFETRDYIFLFQDKRRVFIVDKASLSGGTAEDIRKIFASYPGIKYTILKY